MIRVFLDLSKAFDTIDHKNYKIRYKNRIMTIWSELSWRELVELDAKTTWREDDLTQRLVK